MSPPRKVLFLGWDAADWKIIRPLLAAGQMPHLASLIAGGVSGNLATLRPMLSPMLWTSIATGRHAFEHGILGFAEPTTQGTVRPVTNLSRKTKAVWNIFSQSGLRSIVTGWWPSHPAEPIDGVMVSNHFQRAHRPLGQPWALLPGTIHPESWAAPLAALRLHPAELAPEHILPFVPQAPQIDQDQDRRLETLARILAECTSVHAAATALLQRESWDFAAVYFDAIDHFCHAFMRYRPPRLPTVSAREVELYGQVVDAAYRYHDLMLGTYLSMVGPDATIILASDHGFHPDHLRPSTIPSEPAGPAVEHRGYGILVLRGPQLRQGARIHGAGLLDLAPTLLTLFGLPIGRDLPGRPLLEAFLEPPAVATIPTWENLPGPDGRHPASTRLAPAEEQAFLEQLVALGYVDPLPADQRQAVRETARELDYNLARSLLASGRVSAARPLLENLWRTWPLEHRFAIQLFEGLLRLPDHPAARVVLQDLRRNALPRAEEARRQGPPPRPAISGPADIPDPGHQALLRSWRRDASLTSPYLDFLEGRLELARRNHLGALTCFERAAAGVGDGAGSLLAGRAEALLGLRRYAEAESAFRRMLELDPEQSAPHLGLARLHWARRRYHETAAAALQAVEWHHFNPWAHYLLGLALARLGWLNEAAQALEVALRQQPRLKRARRRLIRLYQGPLQDPAKAEFHQGWFESPPPPPHGGAEVAPAGLRGFPSDSGDADLPVDPLIPASDDPLPFDRPRTAVIVSGLPRSGTSLVMQMLEAGGFPLLRDDHRPPDEHNPRGYHEFEPVRRFSRDQSWARQACGRAVKIVAPLVVSWPVGVPCRIIFLERDLEDILHSQLRMTRRLTSASAEPSAPDAGRLRAALIGELWRTRQWISQRGWPCLTVSYAALLRDPLGQAGRIARFLGGGWSVSAMAACVDPRLQHQGNSAPRSGKTR